MKKLLLAFAVVVSPVVANLVVDTPRAMATERSHSRVLAAFRDVVTESTQSTVRIFCDGRKSAMGTVVSADGYVLTKASELRGKVECQLHDGRRMEAKIVGRDNGLDIAMLKIEAKDLKPVSFDGPSAPPVGSLLATPGIERDPLAIGILSVSPRNIPAPSGALGVQLDTSEDVARIEQVMPGSAAEKAGLQADDVITHVNEKSIKGRQEMVETIRGYMPGERVSLKVKRGKEELTISATLGSLATLVHGDRADFQNNLGGSLSTRRAGFVSVIQHDTVLRPSDCGGPLVDLDGRVIGINIARAGRVESYALTLEVVKPLLESLMSGNLAGPADKAKVDDKTAAEMPKEQQPTSQSVE
ncbi:PDZ/DHR/GLGF domain protein [Pirellula staleyi DSM 6068]|uniref:PDZ/DHR/GLGF domain protein n=1 Tax=Pirellula staleyi (strain ATCC 27377 / DSM 6068 / ICPB 4128) TaxID=530564 RepID=D2R1W9_PIRSD|nr:PDZ domain-containing protein [Pirellula staleyi]ADB18580.1 PDZ/DHR/GLGF domain protein [Pirellula staleyi DSM 6068]